MSRVYEAKLSTKIERRSSPLLHDFLDKSINSKIDPDGEYWSQFNLPDLAPLAFNFIRYARAPEFVWSSPYSDNEKNSIAQGWIEHSKSNSADAIALNEICGVDSPLKLTLANSGKYRDIRKLQEAIGKYPERSFENNIFFFSTEYASNDMFSFEQLVEFLNQNRDTEEKLYTAFLYEEAEMPIVKLYVDDNEISLFEGSYSSGRWSSVICYDRNGYFCGENKDRLVHDSPTGCYEYLPPVDMKYRINWLKESDVRAVKAAYDFYKNKPKPFNIKQHISKREQRELDAKEQREKEEQERQFLIEKKRIKELSDEDLLKEHKCLEEQLYSNFLITNVKLYRHMAVEINARGLKADPRLILDPKGDYDLMNRVTKSLTDIPAT